ncbi:ABC transporter ATP-binding protein [Streptomyces sodiiphilus]|uniref:ABC transporter ATP-binding protein n=1 Tax=Streptomyces sodiiphilus TaxID=226217 RepID=A0ABP5B4I6_9ACTN
MNTTFSDGSLPAVRLSGVRRTFVTGRRPVVALDSVTVTFRTGTFTAVMGPSGSGKSTLLQCAAGLDRPDSGSVVLGNQEITGLREKQLTRFRRENIGFVFQAFNLLPALTVADNVGLPLRLAGAKPGRDRIDQVLARVGLADRRGQRPAELSGGQQQRVAIARALITEPTVIFGDEPTGSLDTRSAREILLLLREAVHEAGRTTVIVTHDPVAASMADRTVFLADGRIVDDMKGASADTIAERMTHLGAWSASPRAGEGVGRC